MNATVKKYLKVSLTLGLIAGGSALLIGVTNLVTANRIAQNKVEKEQNGLKQVFDQENQEFEEVTLTDEFTYVDKLWTVKVENKDYGFIYKTTGKNSYGEVSLLLGFIQDKTFSKMVILENTETYGSTLEENYIDSINGKEKDFSEVSCGATYGAKLIQSMYVEAKDDVMKR